MILQQLKLIVFFRLRLIYTNIIISHKFYNKMSNYDTLNISLQTDNKRYESRISKTIDVDQRSDD